MKNLEEIKNEIAVKHLFENFEQIITCIDVGTITANTLEDILNEVAEQYANQCCDEQILKCAESAIVGYDHIEDYAFVDKQSILKTPNVVTTK